MKTFNLTVEKLIQKKVSFYIAFHLQDLLSCLDEGALCTKRYLKFMGRPVTSFVLDHKDVEKGHDDLFFGNLADLGEPFAMKGIGVPPIYGTITMEIDSRALRMMDDVAVTLCSVTSCDRDKDSLSNSELDKIYDGSKLKSNRSIREQFHPRRVGCPEISFAYGGSAIPLDLIKPYIRSIRTEHVQHRGERLAFVVYQEIQKIDPALAMEVLERRQTYPDLFEKLVDFSAEGNHGLYWFENDRLIQKKYQRWLELVRNMRPGPGFMLETFLRYLNAGTLIPMEKYCSTRGVAK